MTDQHDKLIYSGPELHGLRYGEMKWYLENYIPEEGIVLVFGKYGTYKTPLTLNMAKAIETGQDELWGLSVKRASPLLYVSADTPPRIVHPRMIKLGLLNCTGLDVALNAYPGIDVVNLQAATEEARKARELQALHQIKEYKVVFVDSLRAVHNLDDKESSNTRQVYGALAKLFPGAVVVVIHHARKDNPDETEDMRDESFSGSQALMNHATVGLRVLMENKRQKKIQVRHVKSQAGPLQHTLNLIVQDEVVSADESRIGVGDITELMDEAQRRELGAKETDLLISERLGVSERSGRRWRRKWLETHPEWPAGKSNGKNN